MHTAICPWSFLDARNVQRDNAYHAFHGILDCFKTRTVCDQAVKEDSFSFQFDPDWFVTREWMSMWYDDYCDGDHWDNDDDEDKFFVWYDGYKNRKAQKPNIKEELLPIAWHPSRYWDWCMSEDEKKETEKLWS